tara:strand:+ start:4326 stop:5909 length:1584 start_codon:yes stop_codon:yes gene_type:complete
MGYSKQRMANIFAGWTKIRKREDSIGQIMYQPFGNAIDSEIKNLVILQNSLKLRSKNLEVLDFYTVELEEDEHIEYSTEADIFEYPEVYNNLTSTYLTRYDRWEDFFYKVPDSFQVDKTRPQIGKVWDSESPSSILFLRGEHLGISVSGSTHYSSNRDRRNNDIPFGGYYCLIITGLNEEFQVVTEYVPVFDDGYYETNNVFRSIKEIDFDGFDGKVEIFFGRRTMGSLYSKKYGFEIGSTQFKEGSLEVEAVVNEDEESFLQWRMVLEQYGVNYRNREETPEEIDDLRAYVLFEERLFDGAGNPYTLEDFFINPINSRFYCLDNVNRIHIHEFYLTDFKISPFAASDNSPIKLEVEKQRVSEGEEFLTEAIVLNSEIRVNKFCLKVQKPDGQVVYFDKSGVQYPNQIWIDGIDHPFPEHTWKDFRFIYKYDSPGQYDWNIEVDTPGEIFSYNYSILCESNIAIKTYSINKTGLNSIYLSKENFICVENDEESYLLSEVVEGFFGDFSNQRLIFRKKYRDIDVVVGQ